MLVSARAEKRHVNRFGDPVLGQISGNPIFFSLELVAGNKESQKSWPHYNLTLRGQTTVINVGKGDVFLLKFHNDEHVHAESGGNSAEQFALPSSSQMGSHTPTLSCAHVHSDHVDGDCDV